MDHLALFNRSFLDVTQFAKAAYTSDGLFGPSNQPRMPLKGSVEAKLWLSNGLRALDLYPKPNQDFNTFATDWERRCSRLISKTSGTTLDPIVGQKDLFGYPVIGYHGNVRAEHIIIPNAARESEIQLELYLAKEVPAFVTNGLYPNGGSWRRLEEYGGVFRYTVVTNVDGGILSVLGSNRKDDSIAPSDAFMIIGIGSLLAQLGASVGRRIVATLVRRSSEIRAASAFLKTGIPARATSIGTVTRTEMMAWESQGGHTLAHHNPSLTRRNLRDRVIGEREVPAPAAGSVDMRVWRGRDGMGRASRWVDEATMHRTILEIISRNIAAIRQAIANRGEWVLEGFNTGRTVGSGWVKLGAAANQRGIMWWENLKGVTIVIRRRAAATAAEEGWYVHTAYPEFVL